MHELGLVNYAVKEVDKFAKERGVTNIKTVTLEFGEVSGIIPAYLYDYWAGTQRSTIFWRVRSSSVMRSRLSHGVTTARSHTAPWLTARPVRTVEAAIHGFSAATR
jgi:hypothetical protein